MDILVFTPSHSYTLHRYPSEINITARNCLNRFARPVGCITNVTDPGPVDKGIAFMEAHHYRREREGAGEMTIMQRIQFLTSYMPGSHLQWMNDRENCLLEDVR